MAATSNANTILAAQGEPGRLHRAGDHIQRRDRARQIGANPLIAQPGGTAPPPSTHSSTRGRPPRPSAAPPKRLRPRGHDHELLHIHPGDGVRPPTMMFIIGTGNTCAFGPPT